MIWPVRHAWFVSTIDIMDIMDQPVISTTDTKHYRRHSLEFKLALVEQTLQDGASVARLARENGVNANQVFAWRKLYREGLLGAASNITPVLLPVTMAAPEPGPSESLSTSHPNHNPRPSGSIRLECAKGCLFIEGVPDSGILDRVLDRLLR